MIEHFNIISCLSEQIDGLLDLIACTDEECVDIKSIKTGAEMVETLHLELMQEVEKLHEDIREQQKLQQYKE